MVQMLKRDCGSLSGEWAGDVDLNDGKLQRQCTDYKSRMEKLKHLGVGKLKSYEAFLTKK